jgi:hypothetical protein
MRDALGPWTVSAATVRAAAAAVGLVFDASVVAVIEEAGAATHSTSDPELPLLAGDIVAFLPSGEHC